MSRSAKLKDSLLGRVFHNKYGETVTVSGFKSAKEVDVVFQHGWCGTYQKNALINGVFKSPYSKTLCSFGFIGEGSHSSKDVLHYRHWHNMITRVFSESKLKRSTCYEGVSVCNAWANFQNFCNWCNSVKGFGLRDDNGVLFNLDKDLLGGFDYSPQNCVFIPTEINSFLTDRGKCRGNLLIGVSLQGGRYKSTCGWLKKAFYFDTEQEAFLKYKSEKELRAKQLAEYWKASISNEAYESLINFRVN